MRTTATPTLTVSEIAKRIHQPQWRVEYLISTRGIRPVGRAGNVRIFDERDVEVIRHELDRIDDERRAAL